MKKSIAILLMSLTGTVQASGTPPVQSVASTTVGTQGQLDALNAENALLQVELKNLELKEKIKNGGKETGSTSATTSILPTGSGKSSFYDDMPDAKVVLVSGEPGRAIATIIVNGATVKAGAGKFIRGLGMVKSVSLDEVIIQTKKTEFALPFVADTLSAPSGASGGMSIPPLPAMPSPMGVR